MCANEGAPELVNEDVEKSRSIDYTLVLLPI